MKKSRFSEEQIACALRTVDGGALLVDVCSQIGMSEATFCTKKMKYSKPDVSELRKLRQLGEENTRSAGDRQKDALRAVKRRELAGGPEAVPRPAPT